MKYKNLILPAILIILIIATVLGKYKVAELQNKLIQERAVVQDLQNQNEIQKRNYAETISWKAIAIEHLIRMADLTLNTTKDVKTALAFLLAAKKYTNEKEELAINHALNRDITSLQAVIVVDPEELILKIDIVSQQIDTLPIMPSRNTIESTTTSTIIESQPTKLLNRLSASIVKALKDIVIVRSQAVEPMPSPQQETILRLNIQAKLLQAELAVMQRQNKLYQVCLTQVVSLITKYFACNNTATVNILHMLQELQQANLQPDLPAIAESLMAIQKS
ncbi:MAG: uroporphyrinogen-III C-methyltransferase [bacterium]